MYPAVRTGFALSLLFSLAEHKGCERTTCEQSKHHCLCAGLQGAEARTAHLHYGCCPGWQAQSNWAKLTLFFFFMHIPRDWQHLDLQNAVLQFQLVHAKKTALALSALQTAHGASAARATGGEQRASPNGHRWVTKAMVGWEYWGLALPPRERHRCKEEERKAAWSTTGTRGETGTAGSSFL